MGFLAVSMTGGGGFGKGELGVFGCGMGDGMGWGWDCWWEEMGDEMGRV